jgi:hypothetical protein
MSEDSITRRAIVAAIAFVTLLASFYTWIESRFVNRPTADITHVQMEINRLKDLEKPSSEQQQQLKELTDRMDKLLGLE